MGVGSNECCPCAYYRHKACACIAEKAEKNTRERTWAMAKGMGEGIGGNGGNAFSSPAVRESRGHSPTCARLFARSPLRPSPVALPSTCSPGSRLRLRKDRLPSGCLQRFRFPFRRFVRRDCLPTQDGGEGPRFLVRSGTGTHPPHQNPHRMQALPCTRYGCPADGYFGVDMRLLVVERLRSAVRCGNKETGGGLLPFA